MGDNSWQDVRLAEVCSSIDYGYTASAKDLPVGPKFLRITDIVPGFIDWKSVPYCEVDQAEGVKYTLASGDVVIARTGATTGYSVYIHEPPDAIFASYLVRLKTSDAADPRFVSYFLKSSIFWDYLHGVLGDKSAQPNASAKTMTQVRMPLPPLPEQKAIAHILGTLDDKIENNRRINETLEAMARAIFKCWFVDFDPVRAKAEGRAPEGMDTDTAALFPDSFEDSPLGKIPAGWGTMPVYSVAKFINGKAFRQDEFSQDGDGKPVIKIAELKNGITDQTQITKLTYDQKYEVHDGDLLFSWSGSPETSIDTFVWIGATGWLNQHIFAVRDSNDLGSPYLYSLLKYLKPEFIEIARNKQTTGLGHVTAQDMKRLLVPDPGWTVISALHKRLNAIYSRMILNLRESATLAATRDALLPKLLSGEVRVKEAEAVVGEAV